MSKTKITFRIGEPEPGESREPIILLPPGERVNREDQAVVIPLFREDVAESGRFIRKSPYEEETDRIERLIRESGRTSAGFEPAVGNPPISGPDDEPRLQEAFEGVPFLEEPVAREAPVYRRVQSRAGKGGISLLLSGLGAILTGLLLGSIIFDYFRGEPDMAAPLAGGEGRPQTEAAPFRESESAETGGDLAPQAGESGTEGAAGWAWLPLPEKTYYVVQNGVFSTKEGAAEAVGQLREKGLAGAVEDGEKLAVYAGIAEDRDDALLIAQQLKAEQMEIFIKPYVLPELTLPSDGTPDGSALLDYVTESRTLMGEMMEITLRHLNEADPKAIPDDRWQKVKAAHQRWTEAANRLPSLADDGANAAIGDMNRAVASAMSALEQYGKKPAAAYLWQAQSAMMEHAIAQKKWLDRYGSAGLSEPDTAGWHPA